MIAALQQRLATGLGVLVGALACTGAYPLISSAVASTAPVTVAFGPTGAEQSWKVPAGVTSVHVVAVGGPGGSNSDSSVVGGHSVARAAADLPVTPGQALFIEVGGIGGNNGDGGFNGGAAGGPNAGGGGGASDVRTVSRPPNDSPESLASRLIVAGGGGGAGASGTGARGGVGGGADAPGGNGQNGGTGTGTPGGEGGNQTAGGRAASFYACSGDFGRGGCGASLGSGYAGGGGGGGGYFGGGGGASPGSASGGGGGGGGSSFFASSAANTSFSGIATPYPSVTLSYTPPSDGSGGGSVGGSGGGLGGGSGSSSAPPTAAAVVSNATQTADSWREGNRPATISRSRPPVGTTFKFSLDKSAAVRFDFTQAVAGHKFRGTCVAETHRDQTKRKCARSVIRGTLSFRGHAGVNSLRFEGRLSSTKKLKPGHYTLAITATTPGVGYTSKTLRFTIVR